MQVVNTGVISTGDKGYEDHMKQVIVHSTYWYDRTVGPTLQQSSRPYWYDRIGFIDMTG